MDSLDWLRTMGEKMGIPLCEKDPNADSLLPLAQRLKYKWKYSKYTKPRRYWGRKILGNPRYGQGVLMQVDLGYKSKEEVEAFWEAIKLLRKAGITFDTGMGCKFDMELDWSLRGAIVRCKKCGYDSEKNRIDVDNWHAKDRFFTPCVKCGETIDSSDGYWSDKPHWWNKTLYYHTKCHDSKCSCVEGGACNFCHNGGTGKVD